MNTRKHVLIYCTLTCPCVCVRACVWRIYC